MIHVGELMACVDVYPAQAELLDVLATVCRKVHGQESHPVKGIRMPNGVLKTSQLTDEVVSGPPRRNLDV
jgi:hypothetical protein